MPSGRGRTLLLMVLAVAIGYLPWYNFSAVLPPLQRDLGIGSREVGTILAAFQLGYVLVVVFTGWLADKLGARWLIAAGLLGMAVCSTAFALLARDFAGALVLRLLTGMAAGAIYAPGMALLAGWFPPGQRGNAIGAFTGALTVAYAGAYFVAAPIAAGSGWRAGIFWTSLPGFVAVLLMLAVRESHADARADLPGPPPASSSGGVAAGGSAGITPATGLLHVPAALITAAYMGHMWELYAFLGWVGPALAMAAVLTGVPEGSATALGGQAAAVAILMGAPAPWLLGMAADRFGRSRTAALCLLCSAPASLLFGFLVGGPLPLMVGLALWYGFWVIADSAIYKAGLTELVAPPIRATSLGLQSALGFGVSVVSPQVFGLVLEATNGGGMPVVWGPAFAMLALGPALSVALLVALRRQEAAKLMAGGRR